jgi:peptidoglycan/xylan/chitin deacetylase (PgdA/CDA1 family)
MKNKWLVIAIAIAVTASSIELQFVEEKNIYASDSILSEATESTTGQIRTKGITTTETELIRIESETTELITTEPVTTELITTEPVTTEPVTTEPPTTEQITKESPTTKGLPTSAKSDKKTSNEQPTTANIQKEKETLPYVIVVPKKKIKMETRTTKKLRVKIKKSAGFKKKANIKYKSSNKKIATVSKKGVITAVSQGKCKIIITGAGKQKKTVKVSVKNPSMKKVIYLTFDDGPGSNVTPKILTVLKKYNAKASFFLVGTQANANMSIVKREKREGHTLAIHTYTHNYSSIYASDKAYIDDFNKVEKIIKGVTGKKPRYWRFPGGGNNHYITSDIQKSIIQKLHKRNYIELDWSAATNDATGVSYTAEQMINFGISSIESAVRSGRVPVVLMHDTNAKGSNPQVTEAILKYFTAKGYKFKGLDDYYGSDITFKK